LIQIHNKSTYNRIYNSFSKDFIDTFIENKVNGFSTKDSLIAANMAVQVKASLEIAMNSPNKLVAIKAYKNIKQDTKLIERAIKYYQGLK
jgi:polyhydroxyalkanoate synthesis regulator protein